MMRWIVSALGYVLFTCAALAQVGLTFPGPGMPAAAAGTPPSVAYIGHATSPSGTSTATYTWASMPLDNPAYLATRRIIVVLPGSSSGRNIISSGSSICGQSIGTDFNNFTGSGINAGIASAVVPTGTTTCTLVIAFSSSNFAGGIAEIYSVDNSLLSSSTPVQQGLDTPSGSTATTSVAVLSGGFLLVISNSPGVNPTSTTGDTTLTQDALSFARYAGHANNLSATASYHVTTTWTGGGEDMLMLWAFR